MIAAVKRPGRRHLARLLLAAAAFLVADVSLGWLRRALNDRADALAAQPAEAADTYRTRHPYYSHDLVPGFDGVAVWGPLRYPMRTNALGFRDSAPRDIAMQGSGSRLLVIGDSFVEGQGLAYEHTIGGRLQAALAPGGTDVLNAGVASYAPAIYWKKIEYLRRERGLQFDALLVFIDISDIQDEAAFYRIDESGRVVDAPRPSMNVLDMWTTHSATYRAAVRGAQWLRPHPPLIGCWVPTWSDWTCRAGWTSSDAAMTHYGRDGLRYADEHMTRLAALLREWRIPLTVVVYPWRQQLQWNDRASLQTRHWQAWARRERAGFIELFTPFFAEVDRLGLPGTLGRYFIADDIHWTADGHRLAAEAVVPHLIGRARQ